MALRLPASLAFMMILTLSNSWAHDLGDQDFFTVDSTEISEVHVDELGFEQLDILHTEASPTSNRSQKSTHSNLYNGKSVSAFDQDILKGRGVYQGPVDPTQIIGTTKDLVALGEAVYQLVTKGRPTNTTNYAPISVVPKVIGVSADELQMENWTMARVHTFQVLSKNIYGMEVVKFRFSVIYASNGTYNGTGAYITAAQIVPTSVSTVFGYEFSSTMKLGGITNHGTKANPIAGAVLLLEYSIDTFIKATTKVESFHLTGLGGFKRL